MSNDIWFLSDHHFNHENIIKFTGYNGKLIRPGFDNIQHMNEYIVERHNSVVKPGDKVYFGGDMGYRFGPYLLRMNGRKRLIMGNHDDKFTIDDFKMFDKVLSWRMFKQFEKPFVVSHYPLHPMSFIYRGMNRNEETQKNVPENFTTAYNVHGHIHEKLVRNGNAVDERFFNIACEHLNFTPIHVEDLVKRLGKPQPVIDR